MMTIQEQFEANRKYVTKARIGDKLLYQIEYTDINLDNQFTSVYTRANYSVLVEDFLGFEWPCLSVADRFTFPADSLTKEHLKYFEEVFDIFDEELSKGIEVPVLEMNAVQRIETLDVENLIDDRIVELVNLTDVGFDEARKKYGQYLDDLVDHDGVRAHLPSADEILASKMASH